MSGMANLDLLFVITSLFFQLILIVHFAFRKWRFDVAIRYGYFVYALSLPAAAVSAILIFAREPCWVRTEVVWPIRRVLSAARTLGWCVPSLFHENVAWGSLLRLFHLAGSQAPLPFSMAMGAA